MEIFLLIYMGSIRRSGAILVDENDGERLRQILQQGYHAQICQECSIRIFDGITREVLGVLEDKQKYLDLLGKVSRSFVKSI